MIIKKSAIIFILLFIISAILIMGIFGFEYIRFEKRFNSTRSTENLIVEDTNISFLSDPLGQESRDKASFPDSSNDASFLPSSHKNIIERVQLTLLLSDYYKGDINGVFDDITLRAIQKYQAHNQMRVQKNKNLDIDLLIALGVIAK